MKSPIIKIAKALQSNKRIVMVQLIQELSGEEFETLDDVWSLAEETKQQLRNRLYMLVDYYEKRTERRKRLKLSQMETYESKMNFSKKRIEESKYITIQSVIGFNHHDFSKRILEELEFIGLEQIELAKSLYMTQDRISRLLHNRTQYTSDEIFRISKRLGFL